MRSMVQEHAVNTLSAFHAAVRLGLAASLALAAALGQAQTPGRIKAVPQPAAPVLPAPGAPPVTPPLDTEVPPQTNVPGGRAYGAGVAAPATADVVAGPYTAVQIAQSFLAADLNRDGELTRAEARRLAIAPYSFEEMDSNHDGILTRFEYEDAVR